MRSWTKRGMAMAAWLTFAAVAGATAAAYNSQEEELAIADNWMYVGEDWVFRPIVEREPADETHERGQGHARAEVGPALAEEAAAEASLLKYQVNAGDTLYKISRAFGLTVDELLTVNALDNPNRLSVGQRLNIPLLDADLNGGERTVVQRVLSSTLTAYTAGKESTGKTPSHPAYGITRSGSRAEEGRTIAVDPSIIPLGSTVLIEGIGIRKAEDTGSAIRGSRIDVFMNNVNEALQFGVKKDVTVFVLEDSSV